MIFSGCVRKNLKHMERQSRSSALMAAVLEVLGDDAGREVVRHFCAMRIQEAWRRYDLVSHSKKPFWEETRIGMREFHPILWRYSGVRREWRSDFPSWRGVSRDVLEEIASEAKMGLWGKERISDLSTFHLKP